MDLTHAASWIGTVEVSVPWQAGPAAFVTVSDAPVSTPAGSIATPATADAPRVSIAEALKDWHESNTYANHRDSKRRRSAVADIADRAGWTTVIDITENSVRTVMHDIASPADDKKLAPATIRNKHSALNRFLDHCVDRGWLEENPARAIPMRKGGRMSRGSRPATPEEVEKLLASCAAHEARGDRRVSIQRSFVYQVLWLTGLRRHEAEQLRWEHVDLKGRILMLTGDVTKAGRAQMIPLHDSLIAGFEKLRPTHYRATDRVWPSFPHHETLIQDVERAGIPRYTGLGRFAFHSFRKGLATNLANKGVPITAVQRLLRHSDVRTTSDIYVDERIMPLREYLASA